MPRSRGARGPRFCRLDLVARGVVLPPRAPRPPPAPPRPAGDDVALQLVLLRRPGGSPRPSCSYHLLPESHRAPPAQPMYPHLPCGRACCLGEGLERREEDEASEDSDAEDEPQP
ncbi:hypothetical protein JYU34_002046 [Plutella xylostella]|uniref:Uncharacterized protein n=1 Tax=Plutella xylostella TaxID=51655 RepID=A0ABQ7R5K3_PLUXY|nr:hypothetical protein JYU34_002046 [Plutella xylostella]